MEEAKEAWRRRARAARRALPGWARERAHVAMGERLMALSREVGARVVGVYAATADEADPGEFARRWLQAGGSVAWPRVEEAGGLGFHRVRSADDLVPGFRGIREPAAAAPRVAPAELDLLVVPGVAFDRRGGRIGQGGGYYDRLLADPALRALRVGLAYAAQVVACVPAEGHDREVEVVLTERGQARGGRWEI